MHPTLAVVGPWQPIHLPIIFAFFLAIVWLWTVLEDRAADRHRPMNLLYFGELVLEAAVPTALTYVLVNRMGPLQVRSYGAMMLLGFAAGLAVTYLTRERWGFSGRAALQIPLIGFAGGILGGRLGFVLLQWEEYASQPQSMMNLWQGGMSWHGGLAGAVLAMWLACALMKLSIARMMDLVSLPLAVGYPIARLGCFLNGCCYGVPSDLPWAVTFPQSGPSPGPPTAVHPTQLYSVVGSVLFTIPLLLLADRWVRLPLNRFMTYLALSSVVRFVVEHFRRGATAEIWELMPVFTKAQAASVAIFVICAVVVLWRELAARRRPAEES